jgi:bifunctional non-homologous end joining protein LigD
LPANIIQCAQAALWLKEELDALQLKSFPKTSGSKGLQVYIPLNSPASYDLTKAFARSMAEHLERAHRELIISKMAKALRRGKVFVDWSQNDEHKTTVCAYSLRAKETPTVSTPVTWEEVQSAWQEKDAEKLAFSSDAALQRAETKGDLFAPMLKLAQHLTRRQGTRSGKSY